MEESTNPALNDNDTNNNLLLIRMSNHVIFLK